MQIRKDKYYLVKIYKRGIRIEKYYINSYDWRKKVYNTSDTDFKGQKIDTNDRNIDEITSNIIDLLKSIKLMGEIIYDNK